MIVISIPAYNEEESLARVISEIKSAVAKYEHKILVLDDGSTDKTVEIAKNAGAIVVSNKRNLGLAETFKREMEECLKLKPEVIVHTDADGQYPASFIPVMIEKVKQGNDLVMGTRFGKGNYSGSLMKKLGNIAFARVFSRLLNMKITDTTTGFRAFTPEIAKLPLINHFTYTQEQLIRAGKGNFRIAEVPITTNKTRKSRLFSNPFSYAFKAWVNLLRIYRDFEPLRFFGIVGFIFILFGVLLGAFILYTIITTSTSGGTPRVVFSMLLILIGIQIGLFGFLADRK